MKIPDKGQIMWVGKDTADIPVKRDLDEVVEILSNSSDEIVKSMKKAQERGHSSLNVFAQLESGLFVKIMLVGENIGTIMVKVLEKNEWLDAINEEKGGADEWKWANR